MATGPTLTESMQGLLESARELDVRDELRAFRERFWIPSHGVDEKQVYFCGHSLGLQPRAAADAVERELAAWRERAVSGHFRGDPPWLEFGDDLARDLAALVGAEPREVTVMNSLTVNLHLLMATFYRPEGKRRKVLIERGAFPSDRYAVVSQIRWHGLDPGECLVELGPPTGRGLIDEGEVEALLQREGDTIALLLWPGVQYASGQAFDLGRIAAAAHAAGARAGFDLAHAAGNLPLALHGSGGDFAAFCTYKYLNGGPGAVAAAFIHQRHLADPNLTRLEGWWGNSRDNRFEMAPGFRPASDAEAWQLSNPPILAMAPLRPALALFREAGMARLRTKSLALTGWLENAIRNHLDDVLEILTPSDPERRGCQLSLRLRGNREDGRSLHRDLLAQGIVTDWREPDIIRVAPVPLYNRFEDCCAFIRGVADWQSAKKAS